MPALSQDTFGIIIEGAIILALLGAIDSLLTSLVADNMTRTRHNSDKELVGQGIGNTIAGLFGAIPGAGSDDCVRLLTYEREVIPRFQVCCTRSCC